MKYLDRKSELKTNLKFKNYSELHTASFLINMIKRNCNSSIENYVDDYIRILLNAKQKTDDSLTCRQHKETVEGLQFCFLDLEYTVKTYCNKDVIEMYYNLWKEVSQDPDSLSQERPYIRYKTSVLEQMIEESCGEELYKMCKEIDLRKDIGSPNTRN